MTLREIRELTGGAEKKERVPSVLMIMEEDPPVVAAEKFGDGAEVTAYQSGHVIYRSGSHATVFLIHACGDYKYADVTGEELITPIEAFMDQPWQIRAMMEGEKRLVHNMNSRRRYARELSFEELLKRNFDPSDQGKGDPQRIMEEAQTQKEEHEKLHGIIAGFSKRHRYVLTECIVKGRKQEDVARDLGTSRANVSMIMVRTLAKLRRYYGIEDQKFGKNCFYRPDSDENTNE